MKSPCYGCDERSVRCHSTCDRYATFRGYCDNIIAARAAINAGDDYRSASRERCIRKNMRRR